MPGPQLDEEAIFHIARKLDDPADRAKYLDQICAGALGLRGRVKELLEVHEHEQEFLKSSADPGPTEAQTPISEMPGQQIGRYKLLQKIGEGGFGVVYMAEQQRPVRRKIALKIIKPGMDTRAVVARFEAERQTLALMDHPNISRVLDGGAHGQWPALLRNGACEGSADHGILRQKPAILAGSTTVVHYGVSGRAARASERHHSPRP